MLEAMYTMSEQNNAEAKSVTDFCAQFVKDDDTEDKFYAAIRDARRAGFKAGVKAVISLLSDLA